MSSNNIPQLLEKASPIKVIIPLKSTFSSLDCHHSPDHSHEETKEVDDITDSMKTVEIDSDRSNLEVPSRFPHFEIFSVTKKPYITTASTVSFESLSSPTPNNSPMRISLSHGGPPQILLKTDRPYSSRLSPDSMLNFYQKSAAQAEQARVQKLSP